MRCPKCGYISFDHIETCLKCKKDISGSTEVEGTTYHAVVPSFLRVPEKENVGVSFEGADDFDEDGSGFSDSDPDALVGGSEEDEGTITFGGTGSEDFMLEEDDESDEEGSFEFDLDDGLDFFDEKTAETPVLKLPDELADISDLAPPEDLNREAVSGVGMNLSIDDELNLDEDRDLDGLDLGLSDTKDLSGADLSLSLDDIDLSAGDITAESSELDDINLDLGLDDFEAVPASAKEKSSGSLDDISLSLD
jgi:hypothetical protein